MDKPVLCTAVNRSLKQGRRRSLKQSCETSCDFLPPPTASHQEAEVQQVLLIKTKLLAYVPCHLLHLTTYKTLQSLSGIWTQGRCVRMRPAHTYISMWCLNRQSSAVMSDCFTNCGQRLRWWYMTGVTQQLPLPGNIVHTHCS